MGPTHLLLLALVVPAIAALRTQMHHHMTPEELQSVFHVDHHTLVPQYQVVQLNHHINKRHVASPSSAKYNSGNTLTSGGSKKSAHDKLSPNEVKFKNAHKFNDFKLYGYPPVDSNLRSKVDETNKADLPDFEFESASRTNNKSDSDLDIVSVLVDSEVKVSDDALSLEDKELVDDGVKDGEHKIRLEAFGKVMELMLKKTDGLFKKDGLKVWTVIGNKTQPHGVEFVETVQPEDESVHIGHTYQDEGTAAALVIRRDPEHGLLVDGSIGHDLVIKPLPPTLSPKALPSIRRYPIPPEQDDEMFMDPNEDDMVSIDTGLPIKRKKILKKNLNDEVDSNTRSSSIHKMDTDISEIEYDDDKAKAEREEINASRNSEDGQNFEDVDEEEDKPVNVREALIKALSGAKHVIYKRDTSREKHDDDLPDYAFMEPDRLQKRHRRSSRSYIDDDDILGYAEKKRSKREAPYVIYPEILVIVDYDGYRLHGGDNLQIKRYFVSFWNGVDLRYKLLKGPKIRISIAGIIISRGRDATPYLERNRVGRDAIDSAAALTDMGKYLFRERRLPVYDIAVAVTKLDMCRRQFANDVCNRGTAGFAYVGGACVVNKRLEKVNSVAIIEDTGGFSGIIVAAHEVGHLLGAVHDGSPPPSYLGGPGAEKCRWEDGFIMSDLRHTEKGFRWSPCSVLSFHHFLNGDTATCLYNSPHEDESLPRVLPGKLLSLDAQCRKDRGTSACFKDERVCAQLFCFDAGSGYCVAYRPAAEGSPCGDGQYCINGRCVAEHENIIPDYSYHTPSYIRRDNSPFYNNETVHSGRH